MDDTTDASEALDRPGPSVVLVLPRGVERPDALIDLLDQRHLCPLVVRDAAEAMVRLSRQPVLAVVLVLPQALSDRATFARAVARHYPAVWLWRYDPRSRPALGQYRPVGEVKPAAMAPPVPPANVRADLQYPEPPPARVQTPAPTEPQVVLTDEELATLLGPAPEETGQHDPVV